MDYSKLFSSIKTIEDRERLRSEISLALEVLFHEQTEFERVLNSEISSDFRSYILGLIAGRPLDEALREKISETFAKIKKKAEDLQVITLTLAFEARQSTIDKISRFVGESLGEDIIIETKVEQNILGGAIIIFNGLYRDYSLKTKLEEVFKNKREELLASIK